MRYRYLDDFRRGISVFAIFAYGIAVLGTPQCPPLYTMIKKLLNPIITTRYRHLLQCLTGQFFSSALGFGKSYFV